MILREMRVEAVAFSDVSPFVELHHYSKSVKGITPEFCFAVRFQTETIGAAIFGKPAYEQQRQKYSNNGDLRLTELRRFVMVDDTPRNSESFVLGIMFRMLAKASVQRVLSYADPSHGHVGTIYRATGFRLVGQTPRTQVVQWHGKRYAHRSIDRVERRKHGYEHVLTPSSEKMRLAVVSGEAKIIDEPGKFIYVKDIKFSTRCLRRCVPGTRDLRPDAKRLRAAVDSGAATIGYEDGKFIYIKDLKPPLAESAA